MKAFNQILLIFVLLVSLTSFKMPDNNIVRISPMPIKTYANVTCEYAILKIEVYNILGIQVIDNNISEGSLDFSNLPSGYYIVKVYTSKGEFVKRVQKN